MSTYLPSPAVCESPKAPKLARVSPYPARYPWPGDPLRGGVPAGLGHAGRSDLRLALVLGRPLDFSSTGNEAS